MCYHLVAILPEPSSHTRAVEPYTSWKQDPDEPDDYVTNRPDVNKQRPSQEASKAGRPPTRTYATSLWITKSRGTRIISAYSTQQTNNKASNNNLHSVVRMIFDAHPPSRINGPSSLTNKASNALRLFSINYGISRYPFRNDVG